MDTVRNYQKELNKILEEICHRRNSASKQPLMPRLFLHSCCAPCSSYVLEYLHTFFPITVFYYNPNISMEKEYRKRVAEQKRLIAAYNEKLETVKASDVSGAESYKPAGYPISIVEGDYEPETFFRMTKGMEQCPEGGERCFACYELRLRETAKQAAAGAYDYFATTLTISPLKNAKKLNEIGEKLAGEYGIAWLPSDFKKKNGYRRSIELSKEYDLYRQDYCGCIYSKREREKAEREKRDLAFLGKKEYNAENIGFDFKGNEAGF